VQKHEFFKPINWRKLEQREVRLAQHSPHAAVLNGLVRAADHRTVQADRSQRAVRASFSS
jgi:hypothetical protein